MVLTTTSKIESIAQLLTVMLLFVLVLGATWLTTRYIAGVQKGRLKGSNFEAIDTFRLTQNKYVQIIRIGKRYLAVAICKDQVTVLCELEEDEVVLPDQSLITKPASFEEFLGKAKELTIKSPKSAVEENDKKQTTNES